MTQPLQPQSPKKPQSSRLMRGAATVLALTVAGGLSVFAATTAANLLEERLGREARAALSQAGYDWAEIEVSGLQVRLQGTAPNEVQRFRALLVAEGAVDAGQVIDQLQVAQSTAVTAPDFEVELLRNDEGISIIGLVPAGLERDDLTSDLKKATGAAKVTDLLEIADYAVPEGWDAAFAFGLKAAEFAPRAKISIAPGRVTVTAITDSRQEKAELEAALKRAKPATVALATDITAPRPVISPFTLRLVKDEAGARFDACAADTEEARDRILAAASRAGVGDKAACQLGLGAPSRDWGQAAEAAIAAVEQLDGGQITLSGTDLALQAPAGTSQARLDETVARLQSALPAIYSLTASIATAGSGQGPAEFSAVAADSGSVVLRGRITDQRMRDAVESFARSRFGQIDSALRIDPEVPSGWTVRVIAALEAMADLQNGTVHVSPEMIRITGVSGSQTASDSAATALAERLGAGANYELSIRYNRRLDPLLGLPSGPECVDRLNVVMRESLIGFEPNKSVIAGDPTPTLEQIATAMGDCQDFRIEIGGHTDSQGSDGFNADLSRKRAQAILEAMTASGIDTQLMTARGYGESMPIADNETEEGREANRRIEFKLLADEPVQSSPSAAPALVSGVTADLPAPDPVGPQLPATADVPASDGADAADGPDAAAPLAPADTGAEAGNAVPDELREYAQMMSTILVSELVQMGHIGAEGLSFDGEQGGEQGGEGEEGPDAAPEDAAPVAAAESTSAEQPETAPADEAASPDAPEAPAADDAAPAGPDADSDADTDATAAPEAAAPAAPATSSDGADGAQTGDTATGPSGGAAVTAPDPVAAAEAILTPLEPAPATAATTTAATTATTTAAATAATNTAAAVLADVADPLDLANLTATGLPDWPAIRAATGIGPEIAAGHAPNPAQSASTAGLAPLQDQGESFPVLTPDETTPRPRPRPTP